MLIKLLQVVYDHRQDQTFYIFLIQASAEPIGTLTFNFPECEIISHDFIGNLEWTEYGLKLETNLDSADASQVRTIRFKGQLEISSLSGNNLDLIIPPTLNLSNFDLPSYVLFSHITLDQVRQQTRYHFIVESTEELQSCIFGLANTNTVNSVTINSTPCNSWEWTNIGQTSGLKCNGAFSGPQKWEICVDGLGEKFESILVKLKSANSSEIYPLAYPDQVETLIEDLSTEVQLKNCTWSGETICFEFLISSLGQTPIQSLTFGFPKSSEFQSNFLSPGQWITSGSFPGLKFTETCSSERIRFVSLMTQDYLALNKLPIRVAGISSFQVFNFDLTPKNIQRLDVDLSVIIRNFKVIYDQAANTTEYTFLIETGLIDALTFKFPDLILLSSNFTNLVKNPDQVNLRRNSGFLTSERFTDSAKIRQIVFKGNTIDLVGNNLLVLAQSNNQGRIFTVAISPAEIINQGQVEKTYTMGYWKTHLNEWPTGTLTRTLNNRTWQEIMELPAERTNKWVLVAKQWIATQLNSMMIPALPETIQTALEDLADILMGSSELNGSANRAFELKHLLETFNSGPSINSQKNTCDIVINMPNEHRFEDILDKLQEVDHKLDSLSADSQQQSNGLTQRITSLTEDSTENFQKVGAGQNELANELFNGNSHLRNDISTLSQLLIGKFNRLESLVSVKFASSKGSPLSSNLSDNDDSSLSTNSVFDSTSEILRQLFGHVSYVIKQGRAIISLYYGIPKIIELSHNVTSFELIPAVKYHTYHNLIIFEAPAKTDITLKTTVASAKINVYYVETDFLK